MFNVTAPKTCFARGFESELVPLKNNLAWVTELLEDKRFQVAEYRVLVMCCPKCGKHIRAQHADLNNNQCGATVYKLGKNLVATLLAARYEPGIPERKLLFLAGMLLGLAVTQGAVNQTAGCIARRSAYLHHNDTGWQWG